MTPLLQDPATYDSRPSAPTRRGPGRCCPPRPAQQQGPEAPLSAAGSRPLVTLRGLLWALLPQPDPWQRLVSALPRLEPLPRPPTAPSALAPPLAMCPAPAGSVPGS